MKKLLIIGIGAGDPDFITMQAVKALNIVDVFFMLEKGAAKDAMVELRREICRRYAKDRSYRMVEAPSPRREPRPADYAGCVDDLNRAKQETFERMIADGLGEGQVGAILAWGDPVALRQHDPQHRGDRHTTGNRLRGHSRDQRRPGAGRAAQDHPQYYRQPVEITTGRRLAEGWPAGVDSVVVMLDGEETYRRFADQDIDIYWGAYLGTPDEILIAGRLKDVSDEIHRVRAAARGRNGWIMDTYLMRRR
jgi:precorrin-6A synthase